MCVQEPCVYLLSAASVVIRNTNHTQPLPTSVQSTLTTCPTTANQGTQLTNHTRNHTCPTRVQQGTQNTNHMCNHCLPGTQDTSHTHNHCKPGDIGHNNDEKWTQFTYCTLRLCDQGTRHTRNATTAYQRTWHIHLFSLFSLCLSGQYPELFLKKESSS